MLIRKRPISKDANISYFKPFRLSVKGKVSTDKTFQGEAEQKEQMFT